MVLKPLSTLNRLLGVFRTFKELITTPGGSRKDYKATSQQLGFCATGVNKKPLG
uniref:Uncharacterized protein n=1 Tax=Anguilla anguilla TaxID=7936 RepID=A0A0E9STH5_ANGAN